MTVVASGDAPTEGPVGTQIWFRLSVIATAAILVALAGLATWNAFTYPSIGGYDAQEYISYARGLVDDWSFPPHGEGAYYTPPGYMFVAGLAGSLGRALSMHDPDHLGQLLNALATVIAGGLVFVLARIIWPERHLIGPAAVGFFAFLPVVLKSAAMFHPEPLGMLLTTASLCVLALMLRRRAYSWRYAVPLGVLLGLGQLVRAWALWAVVVAIVVLLVAAVTDRVVRAAALKACVLAVLFAVLVPLPWYVHQASQYSNPVFDRPQESEFVLARRPLAFYVDGRFPDVVFHPWEGNFNDRFLPVFYAETWGDYFGIWNWGPGRGERSDASDAQLVRQSLVGLLPSAIALAGLVALLGLALTRPSEDVARLVVALPPVAAVFSVLYLAVAYPTPDGDTIKGTYALSAAPALALCFGFAFDHLARIRWLGIAVGAALVVSALAMLPFLVT